ncbi:MAG: integration host factor subunit beta [Succinivibrio sp.]|nr:integration host factor subunit beta [Succinivibrio sp.]
MTRAELIEALLKSCPELGSEGAATVVHEVIEAMCQSLERGERIELRGFGTFTLRTRGPITAHNPKTGEQVPLGERRFVHFKPGVQLKDRVNNMPH